MKSAEIHEAMRVLAEEKRRFQAPYVGMVADETEDPFQVLISCIISLRTKDEVTDVASRRLFALAVTPGEMAALPEQAIAEAIYPAGFYRTKAATIREICVDLLQRFEGRVPRALDDLLSLKGVGRKTANLVVTMGFDDDGICVDTHVHRITNRWGYVRTNTPDETEFALRKKLPRQYWKDINELLVVYGQNVCKPVSPLCSGCRLANMCRRVGITHSR